MGLERASTIGGDGIGVAGFATSQESITSSNQVQTFGTPLLVKNLPKIDILFAPTANPAGATGFIQIAQRQDPGQGPGSLDFITIQQVVLGTLAPVVVEFDFPTVFVRVGITGSTNPDHTFTVVIGAHG